MSIASARWIRAELGAHGLPLFGTGDWNDGMNRVGVLGRGSVWMAGSEAALTRFAHRERARNRQGGDWASTHSLQQAIDAKPGRDWYRAATTMRHVLGSVSSDECRIDSIAQSWRISGARARPGDCAMSGSTRSWSAAAMAW